jgi:glutamate racemase
MKNKTPIGIFDSGYGGLTVLKEIVKAMPDYDYIYLGDNARAPYGTRSFETVYEYTLQCVKKLLEMNCPLVILACNTASAKALRTIQQKDLIQLAPEKRVLGVIRPTTEIVGNYTKSKQVGVLGTSGTVSSNSYPIEIEKFFPEINVHQEACPMWVSLVENNEHNSDGADFFVKKHIDNLLHKNKHIDTIILGCTHYPLLIDKIKKYLPEHITLLSQGEIVANSLKDYLKRHTEIENKLSRGKTITFYTTDSPANFDKAASLFLNEIVKSEHITINS